MTPEATPPPVAGFRFAGVEAGIKKRGGPDVAVIVADEVVACAGVFTTNLVVAAPVVQSRAVLAESARARAVVVNSGNANACTGETGTGDAAEMAARTATALGCAPRDIQVCSTGVIGAPLPMDKVRAGIDAAMAAARPDGLAAFARAIMTTDTRPKVRFAQATMGGGTVTAAGACKGAGMIHPNMATMLGFVVTDAHVAEADLVPIWRRVCGRTFNAISVDGDTSTNDTALCLASGRASGSPLRGADLDALEALLEQVAGELARDIVRDAEGATKLVALTIRGAASEADARLAASTVATSPLVKTAIHGEDPNWGRLVAAAGRSGARLDPARITVRIGDVTIFSENRWHGPEAEKAANAVMKTPEFGITLDLGLGAHAHTVFTCDFSADYVRINADYRS
ncbi:bifunctional glutamate N-acetyltransferase/amino-acid acetyltransferase ArgJ [Myxococcota bacterium]|nr:bifunctional glutamate N-acetyltransferase/amino-acid acetyltransferase ArgJ [Myxococcota bacterium]